MALKGLSAISKGLFTLINFKQSSLSIQRSIRWYADMGFGMLSERLAVTLLRAGLLGISARKYTT